MQAHTALSTPLTQGEAVRLMNASGWELEELFAAAGQVRERRTGRTITYSRKVFLPLTNLCRDRCAYCVFARQPSDPAAHTMTPDEVLGAARAGQRAGCKEALFSLGDKPERRYPAHREWLERNGYGSTIEYLAAMCRLVHEETGLLPHSNPGAMTREEIRLLRPVNASLGMMLESVSERLLEPGQAHHQCPDKVPAVRLETLREAGRAQVPFTTGLLIGIGETIEERVETLFAIKELDDEFGHIQEVIVQNFRAKPGTLFATREEPAEADLARTAAVARLIFGDRINLQIPPNLTGDAYAGLLGSGINDWGGVSPVTRDFINPERPWPQLANLRAATERQGFALRERLAVYPEFVSTWTPEGLRGKALELVDKTGHVRSEKERW